MATSGFIAFLGSNPITWAAKKQPTVSRSSTESVYRALASTAVELSWLRILLQELHIYLLKPPLLWCDNLSALALASNPVFHSRTKHIEVDYLSVREQVIQKDIQAQFISTKDQLGDILAECLLLGLFLFVYLPEFEGDVKRYAVMKQMTLQIQQYNNQHDMRINGSLS